MQIVGNLNAERHRERRALHAVRMHVNGSAGRAFWHARDQQIVRSHHQAAFRIAELHLCARMIAHAEAAACDGDFAARQGCCWFHAFDFGDAVHWFTKV